MEKIDESEGTSVNACSLLLEYSSVFFR